MSEPGYQSEHYRGPYPSEMPDAPASRVSVPGQVTTAFWLYIAAAALNIVSFIISMTTIGSTRDALQRQLEASGQPISGDTLDAFITGGIVLSAVFAIIWVGVFVLFAFFMKRGANWARWVLSIITLFSLLNILSGYGVGAIQALVAIVATVLIWLHPSSEYFHAVKERKQAGYR